MLYKKIFFLLLFISISFLGMDRPVIESKQKQAELAQKRLDLGLIHAVKTGNKNKVKLWLSNGANSLALDEQSGKTAFQIANELAKDEIINLFYIYLHPLKQLPPEIGTMVRKYVEDDVARAQTIKEAVHNSRAYLDKNPELIGHLIKKKFGQALLDQELIYAIYAENEYAKILIKIGANVNTVSPIQNMAPISLAMSYNPNLDLLKALIDAGANPNVQDTNGFTPLIKATTYYISDYGLKLIKLLLAAGADPDIKGNIFSIGYIFGPGHISAREYAQNQLNHRNVKNNPQKIKILNEMIKILEDAEALQEAVKEQKPEFKPKI